MNHLLNGVFLAFYPYEAKRLNVIFLYHAGISVHYSMKTLFGSSVFTLLPMVYIELHGVDKLPAVTAAAQIYQALAFLTSTLIASKQLSSLLSFLCVTIINVLCFKSPEFTHQRQLSRAFLAGQCINGQLLKKYRIFYFNREVTVTVKILQAFLFLSTESLTTELYRVVIW